MRDETKYLQGRSASSDGFDAVTTPVHRASTIVFPTMEAFERRYERFYDGYTYGLYGTPTSRTLENRLTELAEASGTVLTPSGMSALTLVLTAFLSAGDRVLVVDTCYGPVRAYCDRHLARFGVSVTYFAASIGRSIRDLLDERVKLVLLESPGSNTMEFMDVPAVAEQTRARGIPLAIDNTWASSVLYKPHRHGVDIVVEALSKHVGGHGDLLMGAVSASDLAVHRRLRDVARLAGLGVSADDCSLALRGLQSLAVRLRAAADGARAITPVLAAHPLVESVLHPDFPDCVGREIWQRDFAGSNGVFSIVLVPNARPHMSAFIDALELFRIGASWGGTQSLVAPQDPTTSRTAEPWRRGKIVRFSVGLEAPEDLVADVATALQALEASLVGQSEDRGAIGAHAA